LAIASAAGHALANADACDAADNDADVPLPLALPVPLAMTSSRFRLSSADLSKIRECSDAALHSYAKGQWFVGFADTLNGSGCFSLSSVRDTRA
jgi:hypothetical protein